MNMARHLAWMLNPNLTQEQVLALVKADCAAEERRIQKYIEDVRQNARELDSLAGPESAKRYTMKCMESLSWLVTL